MPVEISSEISSSTSFQSPIGTDNGPQEHIITCPIYLPPVTESIGQHLCNAIRQIDPNKIALIDPMNDRHISYGQLSSLVHSICNGLLRYTGSWIESSERVMFFADNSIEYFQTVLACWWLGLCITPSKPANGQYETSYHLKDCQARILCLSRNKLNIIAQMLNDDLYRDTVMNQLKLIIIIDDDDVNVDENDDNNRNRIFSRTACQIITLNHLKSMPTNDNVDGLILNSVPYFPVDINHDACIILYTSGTSGLPKGVIHTHRSYLSSLMQLSTSDFLRNHRGSVFNVLMPFGHVSGILYIGISLLNQMTSIIQQNWTNESVMAAVPKYNVQMMTLFSESVLDLCNRSSYYKSRYDLGSLSVIIVGGNRFDSHLTSTLRSEYNVELYEIYGSTEFMASVAQQNQSTLSMSCEAHNLGSPLPNVQMKIVHLQTGFSLPAYQQGEVCFRGAACFKSYLNNDLATNETIDQSGWYHSGDMGYYDHSGQLFITDRIKELIKYKHWSIAPAELECLLLTHWAVASACVVGVKHATEGQHLRAYVELIDTCLNAIDQNRIKDEIDRMVKIHMGQHKRLNGGVRFINGKMPRTVIGKVDRQYFKNLIKYELIE